MTHEYVMQQLAQFNVVLAVGLSDFGETMLGQDELSGRCIFAVDRQHAPLNDARQIPPAIERVMLNRRLQAGAERGVYITGQRFEERGHSRKKVIDR